MSTDSPGVDILHRGKGTGAPSTDLSPSLWRKIDALSSGVLVDPAGAHVATGASSIQKGATAAVQDNATKNGICRMFQFASSIGSNQYGRYGLRFRLGFDVASFPSGTDDVMVGLIFTDNDAAGYGNYIAVMVGKDAAGNWLLRRTGTGSAEVETALASAPAYMLAQVLYRQNGAQAVVASVYDAAGAYINTAILNLPLSMDANAKLVAGVLVHDRAAVARTISGISLHYHSEYAP